MCYNSYSYNQNSNKMYCLLTDILLLNDVIVSNCISFDSKLIEVNFDSLVK